MSPTNRQDADVILFCDDDLPLKIAREKLNQTLRSSAEYKYQWSETLSGRLSFLHHFQHNQTHKYIAVEA